MLEHGAKYYVTVNFNELDSVMRAYEVHSCDVVPNDKFIVVRLDGRSFSKLTKDVCKFEKPFDDRFHMLMRNTTKYLLSDSGFGIRYGYTQSDEISLLFNTDDNTFGRRYYKIITTLAGDCSAKFTLDLSKVLPNDIIASFDCKLYAFDTVDEVLTYFVWRQRDACRNALNTCLYWTLINNGMSVRKAARTLENLKYREKIDKLAEYGINFDKLEGWKKYGISMYYEVVDKEGFNPITNKTVMTKRNTIVVNEKLPELMLYLMFMRYLMRT